MLVFIRSLLLVAAILLTGCASIIQPVTKSGEAPTPVVWYGPRGEDNPDVFVEVQLFQAALVDALNARDSARLLGWMTEPFMTGWWRGERMDDAPANALQEMQNEYLSAEYHLKIVEGADLYNLMGEKNPISLTRPEAGVESAFLVSGWGTDGRDETVLFIARRPDNSLRWHGALLVQGGFTSQRNGGVQVFQNPEHGYRLFLPTGFEVRQVNASEVVILGTGEGHRERGFISVEPANGLTVEEVASAVKADLPAGQVEETAIVAGLEGSPALVLSRLPGQDLNRQVLVIRDDVLYRMTFIPEQEEAGEAYRQMEDLYGTVINTFHFLPRHSALTPLPITNLDLFKIEIRKALTSRDENAIRALMGNNFVMAFWQGASVDAAPGEAAQQLIVRFVPPSAPLEFGSNDDFVTAFGDKTPFVVPVLTGETVTAVFVLGWGLEGKDEALFYISRRADGSLYWKGLLTANGGFSHFGSEAPPAGQAGVAETQVKFVRAQANLNIRRGPGLGFPVLGWLSKGQVAQVTGASVDGGWWRVICSDETAGECWVSADPQHTQPAAGN